MEDSPTPDFFCVLFHLCCPPRSPKRPSSIQDLPTGPGLRVTFDQEGHASVEQRNGETRQMDLDEHLCDRFMRDMKAAAPLNALPTPSLREERFVWFVDVC